MLSSLRYTRRLSLEPLEPRETPAAAALDPTFGTAGIAVVPLFNHVADMAVLPDGRTLVLGNIAPDNSANPGGDLLVTRLAPDGRVDPTFGVNGLATVAFDLPGPPAEDDPGGLAVQPDGKVVVVGKADNGTAGFVAVAARLTADGAIDPTFGHLLRGTGGAGSVWGVVLPMVPPVGTVFGQVTYQVGGTGVALTPDGKIVAAAQVHTTNVTAVEAVRLNPDGAVDPAFGANGVAIGYFGGMNPVGDTTRVAVAPDGSVLAYGTNFGSDSLFKWTPQGVLDPGFGIDGQFRIPETSVSPLLNQGAVAVRPDGSVVLMHSMWQMGPISGKFPTSIFVTTLYQFTPQGAADPGFGTGGSVTSPFPGYDMALDAAGNIVLAGSGSVGRLTPAGVADTSFGQNGVAGLPAVPFTYGVPVAVAVGPGGAVQLAMSQTPGSSPPASYPSLLVSRWLGDNSTAVHLSVAGVPAGGDPVLTVRNPDGSVRFTLPVFEGAFRGGVSVAVGDINGDGTDDIVAGAGPGGGPRVRVFDGATGAVLLDVFAFEPTFAGGVSVAAGPRGTVVVGAGPGGGPHVVMFRDGAETADFFAFDPAFRGGVNVAAGDVDGDGAPDLVAGAGPGGGPHVIVYHGDPTFPLAGTTPFRVATEFYAGPADDRGGVRVALQNVTGDGLPEVVTRAAGATKAYTPLGGDDLTDQCDPAALSAVLVD